MRRDFKAACKRIQNQLDFEQDGMKILYPATPEDIVAEGHALHHCVGGYADRHAEGSTTIMFLRLISRPDQPYYTMEVTATLLPSEGILALLALALPDTSFSS